MGALAKAMAWLGRPWEGAGRVATLWSKGVALHCDHSWTPDYWRRPTEHRSGPEFFARHWSGCRGLVYVRLGTPGGPDDRSLDLWSFAQNLDRLEEPVVLLTTDGDASVPGELGAAAEKVLAHPRVLAWYTQNWDGTPHEKLVPFPIGLDLHTARLPHVPPGSPMEALLRETAGRALPCPERPLRIVCDAHLKPRGPDRAHLARLLAGSPAATLLPRRLPLDRLWRLYAEHAFVVSPRGKGLDCHRTWEALLLGCLVIVRRSSLDPLYEGLAVAVVDEWEECLVPGRLEQWRRELSPRTPLAWERLRTEEWVARARRAPR